MKVIAFIIWMLISLIFVFSIVGLLLFMPKDIYQDRANTPSTWYSMGIKLLDSIVKS